MIRRNRSRRGLGLVGLLLVASAQGGCGLTPKWESSLPAREVSFEEVLASRIVSRSLDFGERAPDEIPELPPVRKLRPCCAFGVDLKVKLGAVPVPLFQLTNILDAHQLGVHRYDAGFFPPASDPLKREKNGLVYTCRGGFIDIAHVRDYADRTLFLAAAIARTLREGTSIDLGSEGGRRTVRTRPFSPAQLAQVDDDQLVADLAEWLAFQVSIWHEIATWYGWSAIPTWSERVSAFSPEDLYSNVVGAKIASALVLVGGVGTEGIYNKNMTKMLPEALEYLHAVSPETGRQAMYYIDGYWWDSTMKLPDKELVRRRNFDTGRWIEPWLVTRSHWSSEVEDAVERYCEGNDKPELLRQVDRIGDIVFADHATLEIDVNTDLDDDFPFPRPGTRIITERDFPWVIRQIRQENAVEFGDDADRPEVLQAIGGSPIETD